MSHVRALLAHAITLLDREVVVPPTPGTSRLGKFLAEQFYAPGNLLLYGDVYDRFLKTVPDDELWFWTKPRFSNALPVEHPRGHHTNNVVMIGNLAFEPTPAKPFLYVRVNGKLRKAF